MKKYIEIDIQEYATEICGDCEIDKQQKHNAPKIDNLKYLADCVSIGENNTRIIEKMVDTINALK